MIFEKNLKYKNEPKYVGEFTKYAVHVSILQLKVTNMPNKALVSIPFLLNNIVTISVVGKRVSV